jgi:hypothetical protein
MGGGLMQLVAYGAQDIYLTGNPQITFFKVVYRRHTNFSMETIQQTINGTSTLTTAASSGTVTISRNGDLVNKVYVRCDQDTANGISGDNLITDVTLEIGGQQIDKHTKEWMQIWAELSTPASKAEGYKYLTGGFSNTLVSAGLTSVGGTEQQSIMVPLQFWFCRNPGLALPLIALQYHEVKMKFTWGIDTDVGRDGTSATPAVEVWCDYIYLDTDERRRFAQVSHEYLIEQLQYNTEGTAASKYKLNFNHPVKELVWTNATSGIVAQKARLTLNGHDRFAEQDKEYFQVRQPLDHHTSVPGYNIKEHENVRMLNTPDRIFDGDHNGTAADGSATLASTTLTFHADQAAGGTDPAARCKIGDILFINYADVGGAVQPTNKRYYVTVTALTATVITFTAYVDGAAAALTDGDNATFSVTDADDMQVTIIGRLQNPQSRTSQLDRNINVYSFALKPEEHQPSGTCNFSRIDTAHLNFSASATVQNVYAVNYNVLRIMSGMGGLAYSN